MFEKILLYIDNKESAKKLALWTLKFAKIFNARIFAVYIINQIDSKPKVKTKSRKINSNQEETAWSILYEIEDDAFEENVKISLIVEEGRPEDKLIDFFQSFEIDVMIVSGHSKLEFEELIKRCQGKILIIK
jgi:nucleotide-binding universal stress UspA family protein